MTVCQSDLKLKNDYLNRFDSHKVTRKLFIDQFYRSYELLGQNQNECDYFYLIEIERKS